MVAGGRGAAVDRRCGGLGMGTWLWVQLRWWLVGAGSHILGEGQGLVCSQEDGDAQFPRSSGGSELCGGQREAESLPVQRDVLLHDCTSWDSLGGWLDL